MVLNDFGPLERRVSKTGREKFVVTVRSEKIVHNFDAKSLGAGVAAAIAKHIKDRIKAIPGTVRVNTLRARKSAARAVGRGAGWALKRYSGGRTGPTPPMAGAQLFNDSGRLANSLVVGPKGDGYTINVAANRFSPETLDNGGSSALAEIGRRLAQYVPELSNPSMLMDSIPIRHAVQNARAALLTKTRLGASKSEVEAIIATARLAMQLFEGLASLAG